MEAQTIRTAPVAMARGSRIGEILLRRRLISREQLELALARQGEKRQGKLGEHLVELGFIDETTLTESLAAQFGVPTINPAQVEIPAGVLDLVPPALIHRNQTLPVGLAGSTLTLAVADPSDHVAINEVKFLTGYDVRVVLAPARALRKVINRLFDEDRAYSSVLQKFHTTDLEVLRGDTDRTEVDVHELERQSEDAPVVALVNAILADAVRKRASDIHIEPYEKIFRVRFRIDGILQEIMKPPLKLKNAIVSRIKIMSDLDIAERRLAHDGRIKLKMGPGREIDVRVSILPTFGGEKIVMRLLDRTSVELDLGRLGYDPDDLEALRWASQRPHGMVLVTGPTGSGKTTTLYAVLNELNKPEVNISTAEDPIEYNIAGINQVQVHEDIGRNFSYVLRAFLRQDPDIIMVGEIRDFETGEMALKAALTGHLVLSTLHTNDAPSTISRLLNMGFEPFLLASALNLVLAQRLIRRLCPECKQPAEVDPAELAAVGVPSENLATARIFRPVGCEECSGTGYRGRIAICEVLRIDDAIRSYLLQVNDGGAGLRQRAIEAGMRTLRGSGLRHLLEGTTTLEEVVRVTAAD